LSGEENGAELDRGLIIKKKRKRIKMEKKERCI